MESCHAQELYAIKYTLLLASVLNTILVMQAWIPARSYPNAAALSFAKQGQQNILILVLLFLRKQFMRVRDRKAFISPNPTQRLIIYSQFTSF